jgi:hypothetical protein
MPNMTRHTVKTPCGNKLTLVVPDEAAYKARIEQLNRDHAEGRGCHLCKPANTPRVDSSLLD